VEYYTILESVVRIKIYARARVKIAKRHQFILLHPSKRLLLQFEIEFTAASNSDRYVHTEIIGDNMNVKQSPAISCSKFVKI